MKIANAIYDIVFKYLMEDERVAKLLLSALLKMEVEDLEFQPQEYTTDIKNRILTIFRLDFKAKVTLSSGEQKVVLIELQKAKFPSDILRFRRYLGEQYSSEKNIVEVTRKDKTKTEALPIITIYFLGYPLDNYADRTIIRVKRQYFDDITDEELVDGKDAFIEGITHDSIIVQVGAIKNKKHRSKIERVLTIFEAGTQHVIEINEADYPEEYKPVVRRLIMAYADDQVRKVMKIEDEVLKDLTNAERRAEKAEKNLKEAKRIAERERKAKEEAKKRAERERKAKEEAKKRAEQAKQKAEQERKAKEEATHHLFTSAKIMKDAGLSVEQIMQATGLSQEEIEKI